MGWAGHVTRMGEKRNAYRILVERQTERDHKDVDVRIILKWSLVQQDVVAWTEPLTACLDGLSCMLYEVCLPRRVFRTL
jgi:hypothetical protein